MDKEMTVPASARGRSLEIISGLGYQVSSSLPLLDDSAIRPDCQTIASRILSLNGVVSLSYGWGQRQVPVRAWLQKESLIDGLTAVESDFVFGNEELTRQMQWRLESLFALVWACELTKLSILDPVPDDLVFLFPSISKSAPTAPFRKLVEPTGTGSDPATSHPGTLREVAGSRHWVRSGNEPSGNFARSCLSA